MDKEKPMYTGKLRISTNRFCFKCHHRVFHSDVKGYPYVCPHSHYDLLDTDQNRLKIRKLFHTSFPQSNLLTFNCSENDQNKYVLEFSVYISYEDLENLWGKLYPKEGMR